MRSFLRGSLGGVSATSATAGAYFGNPQQKEQAQVAPMNAAPNAVRGAHHAMVQPMMPPIFEIRHSYGGGFPLSNTGPNFAYASSNASGDRRPTVSGRVSKWFDARGFGFIEHPDGQTQYFVHARDLVTVEGGPRSLAVGQMVEFEPEQTENGGHAIRVSGPGGAPLQRKVVGGVVTPNPMMIAAAAMSSRTAPASTIVAANNNNNNVSSSLSSSSPPVVTHDAPPPSYSDATEQQDALTTTATDNNSSSAEFNPASLPQPRVIGSIVHWTSNKGFGFVAVDGDDDHYFTHIKDFTCERPHMSPSMPGAGLEIEFTPSNTGNKRRATHVTLPNSVPFRPNVVAQNNSSSTDNQQQSSSSSSSASPDKPTVATTTTATAKRTGPSALALALAPGKVVIPEDGNKNSSVATSSSPSSPLQRKGNNTADHQEQEDEEHVVEAAPGANNTPGDTVWRSGYSSGFVDGQKYIKEEISKMPLVTSDSSGPSSPNVAVVVDGKTGGSLPPTSERKSHQKLASLPRDSSTSPVSHSNNNHQSRSSSNSSRFNNNNNRHGKNNRRNNSSSRSTSPTTTASSEVRNSPVRGFTRPKWFNAATSGGWSSATSTTVSTTTTATTTPPTSPVVKSATRSSEENNNNNNNSAATPATTLNSTEEGTTGGFPRATNMSHQRGGFGAFGRGAASGGRGHRGRGW